MGMLHTQQGIAHDPRATTCDHESKVRGTRTTDQPKALDCEDVQGPRQVVAPSARLCDGRVVNHLHPN